MTKNKKLGRMTLDMVEEGNFLADAEQHFLSVQKHLIGYVQAYGDLAEKAKAELTLRVELQVDSIELETFKVRTEVKPKPPCRPKFETYAIAGFDDAENPCLVVRKGGSRRDNPRQNRLESDGEEIG